MNRNRTSVWALLWMLSLTGCISLPDIDPGGSDAPGDDPGDPHVEEPPPDLGVRFLTPEAKTYTNGVVDVSVEVTNGTPEAVDLFAGDELLATLTNPYSFHWDTSSEPEGSYMLTAKARRGTQSFTTSEAREVVVDRTAPKVVLTTPESGADGVRASHAIQAVLSEPLDPSFATNATVQMKANGNDIALDVKLSPDGKTLSLEPAMSLALPAQVDIVLTDGVRDLAGNSLIPPPGGWNWSAPDYFWIDQVPQIGGLPPSNPVMQLDALGKPVIASVSNDSVFVHRWDGRKWIQLGGELNVVSGSTGMRPSLQIDSAGRPVVAWLERNSGLVVYVKRWTGTAWESTGSALSVTPEHTGVGVPVLQLDVAGDPVVAFAEYDGQASNVYVRHWNGSAWDLIGGALSAKPGRTDVYDVSLRLDPAGNPVVAWREVGDNSFDTAYVSRWGNDQWMMLGSVLGPNPGSFSIDALSLALGADGNPMLGVRQVEITVGVALNVLQWTGEQWEAVGGAISHTSVRYPSLQADALGRPIIAGLGADGIHVTKWTGSAWEQLGGSLRAIPDDYSNAESLTIQLNADGYPVVAWKETLNSNGSVHVAYPNY